MAENNRKIEEAQKKLVSGFPIFVALITVDLILTDFLAKPFIPGALLLF